MEKLKCNRKSGFTLVELIVVLVILGIFAAIGIPSLTKYIDKTNASKCEVSRNSLKAAYETAVMTEKNSGITPDANTFQWEVMNALKLSDHADLVPNGVQQQGSITMLKITGLCGENDFTVTRDENGVILISCSEHGGDNVDTSGYYTQISTFTPFVEEWEKLNGGTIQNRGELYKEYYVNQAADHPAIKVSDSYYEKLKDAGFSTSRVKGQLYWWSYPVIDNTGKVLYVITYANNKDNPTAWLSSGSARTGIGSGYVVIVNGRTYAFSQNSSTINPGGGDYYQTEDALEAALIANKYVLVN